MTTTTVTPEPRLCDRCAGTGLVEYYLHGTRERACTGENDDTQCDGIVR